MSKNPLISQLDTHQINKHTFSDDHDAVRVIDVVDKLHEISITADEDSISCMAKAIALTPSDGSYNCSKMRKMCGFSAASACISADGEVWSDPINLSQSIVSDLCAMYIKVVQGTVVVRS